jgi:hypothetical protein
METDNRILIDEHTYEKLDLLGINREMANNLPRNVKETLANGNLTPLLQVSITAFNGRRYILPLKLQLTRDETGEAILMAYPMKSEISERAVAMLALTYEEQLRLYQGEVLCKSVDPDGSGRKRSMYIQLDPETKSILHRETANVKMNTLLRNVEKINDIELGTEQKQQAREGKPIELNVGGEKVAVGVDLTRYQGFKVIKGDLHEWERQQQMKYDIEHPEYVGLVQTDQNRWEFREVLKQQSHVEQKQEYSSHIKR